RSGDHDQAAESHDGTLEVFTIAQRLRTALTISTQPHYQPNNFAKYAQDQPLSQSMCQNLNTSAKFSVVNCEVIYCGEFYNGQTVPKPVSPADGYVYEYGECHFQHSWRWTTLGSATTATQPDKSLGQLGPFFADIDGATGAVAVSVDMIEDGGNTLVNETTFGRIAVFALCTRGTAGSTVILNDFPPLINDGATQAAGCSYSLRILGARISGSFDGLTVTLEAGSIDGIYGSGLDIAHMVVHRTLAGSPTVTDTTDFTHALATSFNVPLGGSLTTDLCTVAINSAHDYYIVVHTGTGRNLKYAVLPPTFSPASTVGVSLSIARDATADTTINSDYNLDTAYWR